MSQLRLLTKVGWATLAHKLNRKEIAMASCAKWGCGIGADIGTSVWVVLGVVASGFE